MMMNTASQVACGMPAQMVAMSHDRAGMKRFFAHEELTYLARSTFHNRKARRSAKTIARQYEQLTEGPLKFGMPDQRSIVELRVAGRMASPVILSGDIAPLGICRLNGRIGYGAFALTDLSAGLLIGTYTGKLLERSDFDGDGSYTFEANPWHRFFDEKFPGSNPRLFVEGRNAGNELRFINHIDGDRWVKSAMKGAHEVYVAAANVRVYTYFFKGAFRTTMATTRDVTAGEELRLDYGDGYWVGREDERDCSAVYRIVDGHLAEVPTTI